MKKRNKYALVVLGIVVILGGLLAASTKATSSNRLYTVRVNLWEKALVAMKKDEYQKAQFIQSLSQTRLSELEALKAKNELNTAGGNMARDMFNQETIQVQNIILNLQQKEGANSQKVLQLSENLDVQIEQAKVIFNIDQLEVLPEGAPVPKATTTKETVKTK